MVPGLQPAFLCRKVGSQVLAPQYAASVSAETIVPSSVTRSRAGANGRRLAAGALRGGGQPGLGFGHVAPDVDHGDHDRRATDEEQRAPAMGGQQVGVAAAAMAAPMEKELSTKWPARAGAPARFRSRRRRCPRRCPGPGPRNRSASTSRQSVAAATAIARRSCPATAAVPAAAPAVGQRPHDQAAHADAEQGGRGQQPGLHRADLQRRRNRRHGDRQDEDVHGIEHVAQEVPGQHAPFQSGWEGPRLSPDV